MILRRSIAALLLLVASGTAVLGAEQVAVVTGVIYPGQTITEDKIRIAKLRRNLSASANVARTGYSPAVQSSTEASPALRTVTRSGSASAVWQG